MKRVFLIITVLFLFIFGVLFYVLGGHYLFGEYRPVAWQELKTVIPNGFQSTEYESKGWQVVAYRKMGTLIKIALRDGMDLRGLGNGEKNLVWVKRTEDPQPSVMYLLEKKNQHTIVVALAKDGTTIYLSVATMSLVAARHVLQRMTGELTFKGAALSVPNLDLELKYYRQDLFLLAGLILPILIVVVMFIFPGRAPDPEFFRGEAVLLEEKNVYGTFVRGLSRSSNFYYVAITNSRLVVFFFKKPKLEIELLNHTSNISIKGKKIILVKDDTKIILRPENIERWRPFLNRYITE